MITTNTNYEYPFENLDEETKEIIRTNENARIIYDKIIELPEGERLDAVRWCILVLNGVVTAEQAIKWRNRAL